MIKKTTLISLDSKNKIRVAEISYEWFNDHYIIHRTTYQFGGKQTIQPDIIIDKGKASRTLSEQVNLEYSAYVKKYLDRGYKVWNGLFDEQKMRELLGDIKTGQDGIVKPMLAKSSDKVANKFFDKEWYASRKINGVRALIFFKDGLVHTSSRGAINYDLPMYHIIHHPVLENFFYNHPNVILDGELYHHGMTLNQISGLCRHISKISDTEVLEFYWYDIVDTEKSFIDRLEDINKYASEMNLGGFNPTKEYQENELKIQVVPHIKVSGWSKIKHYHDVYVSEGWEGLVLRRLEAVYKPGSRGNEMVKVKMFKDSEYEIVGLSEGLRDEDMCFILKTPKGKQFNCKPIGDRNLKQWYREHINELLGKMLTVKYFEMSGVDGSDVPQLPVGICIRDYE